MRSVIVFVLLSSIRLLSMIFFRHRGEWVGGEPGERWSTVRVIAIMNHTSLYEPLLAGFAPLRLVWMVAGHGVLPVAEKTMKRRIGLLFRFLMRHVVVVTRQRDSTWEEVLNTVDDRSVVTILPEGRMKRRNGLDASGRPMTVRGGIADVLECVHDGHMLLVYSGGLHHIQAPGELFPRLFKTIHARLEILDIPSYCQELLERSGTAGFKDAVIADLERRRDLHCPVPTPVVAREDLGSSARDTTDPSPP